ncbi:hypothetical protein H632_c500p1 [Helicosporidium sp. ATCC 50920]|nr:hypothetical protein H632_c500p1 [Helicosporidium sp. ATCC 50920]|eukprot:KDD75786.1 hypothetical protein H632_c500p1 [Helicosporidium sp. ATCC 50920]
MNAGKAITVRPTPMQKLENVVQEVLSPLGLHLQDCRVECQGSALDLTLPFRFANLPRGAKLSVHTDAQDASVPKEENATDRAVHEIFGQAAVVFSEAEERSADAASSSAAVDAEPDEFYEFTEGDYLVVMAGYASQREPPQMETKQMRQRREDERAASFKTVRLRLHLPEGLVVQSDFGSSATVADVRAFASRAFAPPPASAASLELWVSPPRTALEPPSLSLYQAGLAPAARVHVGLAGAEQGALKPDLFRLLSPPPPRGSGEGRGAEKRERGAEGAKEQAKPAVKSSSKPGDRAVPKWMQRR